MREQSHTRSLKEIVELVLDASGLLEHYRNERDGTDRVENLQELVNAAESFVNLEGFGRDTAAMAQIDTRPTDATAPNAAPAAQGSTSPAATSTEQDAAQSILQEVLPDGETLSPLAAFLTHAALEAGDNQAQAGQDAVQLMTVHAAKGLEFNAVFITGLEEGLFPHENAMNDYDGLEEERRLMYVAITRARQRLYISHAQTRLLHGQTRLHIRSRFLEELPEECLKWITPRRSGFADAMPAWSSGQWGGSESWNSDVRQAVGQSSQASSTSSTGSSASATTDNATLRKGMRVFHNKFGEGQILRLEGQGNDAKAQVQFGRHGVKWLALSLAKLTPITS